MRGLPWGLWITFFSEVCLQSWFYGFVVVSFASGQEEATEQGTCKLGQEFQAKPFPWFLETYQVAIWIWEMYLIIAVYLFVWVASKGSQNEVRNHCLFIFSMVHSLINDFLWNDTCAHMRNQNLSSSQSTTSQRRAKFHLCNSRICFLMKSFRTCIRLGHGVRDHTYRCTGTGAAASTAVGHAWGTQTLCQWEFTGMKQNMMMGLRNKRFWASTSTLSFSVQLPSGTPGLWFLQWDLALI